MAAGPAVAMVTTAPRPAGCPGGGSQAGPCGGLSSAVVGQKGRVGPQALHHQQNNSIKSRRSLLPPQWPSALWLSPGRLNGSGAFCVIAWLCVIARGRVGFQLAAQHAGAECFRIINVLPYL